MVLLHTWKNSLNVLIPRNLNLFLLITINTCIKACYVFIKSAWPLFIPFIFLWYVLVVYTFTFLGARSVTIVISIIHYLFFFLWCVATRPSVNRKTIGYFFSYFRRFWYLIPLIYIDSTFFGIYGLFVSVIFTLFVLDSEGSIRSFLYSLVRTAKMIFYNLPVFLIVSFIISFSVKLLLGPVLNWMHLPDIFTGFFSLVVWSLVMSLYICFFSNIYIKKLHEQFDLYFLQS